MIHVCITVIIACYMPSLELHQHCLIVNWTLKYIQWTLNQNIKNFISRKYIWKFCLQNGGRYVEAPMCYRATLSHEHNHMTMKSYENSFHIKGFLYGKATCWRGFDTQPGHCFNAKTAFPGMGISVKYIRWWWDHLIFAMGILWVKDGIFILKRPPVDLLCRVLEIPFFVRFR